MTKTCRACGRKLPLSEFAVKSKATGARNSKCRPCYQKYVTRYRKEWYERNKAKKKAQAARWRAANKQRAMVSQAEYRNKHREKKRAYDREYHKRNQAQRSANRAAYRARKLKQTITLPDWAIREMRDIYERATHLTKTTGESHHVDHILPLKHKLFCGLHVPWNLQILPQRLNMKKSNTVPLDMLASLAINCEDVEPSDTDGCEGSIQLQQPHRLGRRQQNVSE